MSATHDDRRSHPRFEVNRPAVVIVGGIEIHCTVQNLSSLGAGLVFAPGIAVPDEIELQLQSGERIAGRVAWRAYPRCGVQFDRLVVFAPDPPQPAPEPPASGVRGLLKRLSRSARGG